ncbi:hypothetical protein PGT21_012994 [Puccinia graminis f. sp. tritici]|uniref:Uncharacterized protein n=1 Tax=Puccinia graminis f. sp. tritici TaxID=56615 RepID=A0A5B0MBX9_PUCGR|nr:hypothetical protein PGT21_012994 [Puccinia graminis f. sp. tritici]
MGHYTPGALLAERDRGTDETRLIRGTDEISSLFFVVDSTNSHPSRSGSRCSPLPELTSAPRGNFGGVPWMGGWSPRKTVDRQELVRPAAVVTRGIHRKNRCPTTSNCARG